MGFREALKSGGFVITTDIMPPKGIEVTQRLNALKSVDGLVHGVNVTDMPGACLRLGALAVSVKVKEIGFEPILQITCRDRNRISLMSELLSAHLLGINNVLVLGGDDVQNTDNPGTKAVFDLDSPGLIRAARRLEEGYDLGGNTLKGKPWFCLGAALDPAKEPWEGEVKKAWDKAEAGAEFYQTQPIFDTDSFVTFLDRLGNIKVPILGGVLLLTSARQARFFNENVPGVDVPEAIINEMESGDPLKVAMNHAVRLIRELRSLCAGVHIMMVSERYSLIGEILAQAGLSLSRKVG